MKECPKHGWSKTVGSKYKVCAPCNVERVTRRRHQLKAKAIAYKGGKCIGCGYDKYVGALQFHHVDPSKKDFHFGQGGHTRSWDRMVPELDKCVLVCATCHAEVHAGVRTLDC